jgi:hypothetical protein
MNAARYDITIDRAAEYNFVLTIENQLGNPIDLDTGTPATFYGDIRNAVTKQKIVSFSPTILDGGNNGQVALGLTEAQSLLFEAGGFYEYDIFMVLATVTRRLLFGSVTIRQNITKGVPIDPVS